MSPVFMRFKSVLDALADQIDGDRTFYGGENSARIDALLDSWSAFLDERADSLGLGSLFPDHESGNGVLFDDFADHAQGCGCTGCQLIEKNRTDASPPNVPVGGGANLPLVTLGELADYLTTGYWQDTSTVPREFNLETTGPNPKSGVIYFNVAGFTNVSGYSDSNGLTNDRRDLAREAFKLYEEVLGIEFRETTGSADIYFSDNQPGAYAFSTGWSDGIDYSVVNVSAGWQNGKSGYDSYTLQTFLHEIGHALGLGHQGNYNGSAGFPGDALFANDSWQATMMSYFSQTENTVVSADREFLQTPMAVDWLALNALYGDQRANGTTFGSGNAFKGDTVYGFNTNITSDVSDIWARYSDFAHRTASTIVDAGGNDTLDLSGFGADQTIDLTVIRANDREITASDVGGRKGNLTLAVGTVIENAKGGSGDDRFVGNGVSNRFWGNAGDDEFVDTGGTDWYHGGTGSDTVIFGAAIGAYNIAYDAAINFLEVVNRSLDTVTAWVEDTVEWLDFGGTVIGFDDLLPEPAVLVLPTTRIDSVFDNVGPIKGDLPGEVTDDIAPRLTGTLSDGLPDGASVLVFRDGDQIGIARVDGTEWKFWDNGLEEGTYAYQSAVRFEGTVGELSDTVRVTVDVTAPTVTVASITTEDSTPRLSGTVAADTVSVDVTLDGVSYEANLSGSRWTVPNNSTADLAPGTYTVIASATDAAGNRGDAEGTLTIEAPDTGGPVGAPVMEIGSRTVSQNDPGRWFTVTFEQTITDAVVVSGGLTANDSDPAHVRIRNVTDTGFQFQIEEWDYLDGVHGSETVSWIAVSAGSHEIGGLLVEAGRTTARDENFETVALTHGFDDAPVVFAQVASNKDSAAVTTRISAVDSDSFEFQMQEEEAADGSHGSEEIHWLAVETGDGIYFDAAHSAQGVGNRGTELDFASPAPSGAVFVAGMQERNGADTATTRVSALGPSSASLYISEEQSKDAELAHARESVGYLLGSDGLLFA
ncbi:MAG: M10 family metallopeptidase C-terminal domain-containing protein [Pseudomonadota bacterium]